MKNYLLPYKYLTVFFLIGWFIYMLIDDYDLIKKHWQTSLLNYVALWAVYFAIYFVVFSIVYWATCFTIELIKKYFIAK